MAAGLDLGQVELVLHECPEEVHEDRREDHVMRAIPPDRRPVLVAVKGNTAVSHWFPRPYQAKEIRLGRKFAESLRKLTFLACSEGRPSSSRNPRKVLPWRHGGSARDPLPGETAPCTQPATDFFRLRGKLKESLGLPAV